MRYKHDKPWRVMVERGVYGPTSMAQNQALKQIQANDWKRAPILRFQIFQPFISVGNDKKRLYKQLDRERIEAHGLPVSPRPTPGSAGIHGPHELDFTFITHPRHWAQFSAYDMFEHINRILVDAFSAIGLETAIWRDLNQVEDRALDYLEVVTDGNRKVVGSGVSCTLGCYVQDSVIPLNDDFRSIRNYFTDGTEYQEDTFCKLKGSPEAVGLHELGYDLGIEPLLEEMLTVFGDAHPTVNSKLDAAERAAGQTEYRQHFRGFKWPA